MRLIPCMGGFCGSRESCGNYHSTADMNPSERLCGAMEEPERVRSIPMTFLELIPESEMVAH